MNSDTIIDKFSRSNSLATYLFCLNEWYNQFGDCPHEYAGEISEILNAATVQFLTLQHHWHMKEDRPTIIHVGDLDRILRDRSLKGLSKALETTLPAQTKIAIAGYRLAEVVLSVQQSSLQPTKRSIDLLTNACRIADSCFQHPHLFLEITDSTADLLKDCLDRYEADAKSMVDSIGEPDLVPILYSFADAHSRVSAAVSLREAITSGLSRYAEMAIYWARWMLYICTSRESDELRELITFSDRKQPTLPDFLRIWAKSGAELQRVILGKRTGLYKFTIAGKNYIVELPHRVATLITPEEVSSKMFEKVDRELTINTANAHLKRRHRIYQSVTAVNAKNTVAFCEGIWAECTVSNVLKLCYPKVSLEQVELLLCHITELLPESTRLGSIVAACDFVLQQVMLDGSSVKGAIRTGAAAALAHLFIELRGKKGGD